MNRDVKNVTSESVGSINELFVKLKLIYQEFFTLLATILKFKNADLAEICTNVNIDFQIPHALSFPKMYRFANPHKI